MKINILLILSLFVLLPFTTRSCAKASEKSLTIAPLSITFHPTIHPVAKKELANRINNGSTTLHPGVHMVYKSGILQTGAWVFSDSFGNLGGGMVHGVNYNLGKYITVGAVGGLYIRERVPNNVKDFPVSIKTEKVEASPIGGLTVGVDIPVTDTYGIGTNCMISVMVNNCSTGLNIRW